MINLKNVGATFEIGGEITPTAPLATRLVESSEPFTITRVALNKHSGL